MYENHFRMTATFTNGEVIGPIDVNNYSTEGNSTLTYTIFLKEKNGSIHANNVVRTDLHKLEVYALEPVTV